MKPSSFSCAVLTLALLVYLSKAQSGVSYCTSGVSCSPHNPCDLGICCTINMTMVGTGETGTCRSSSDIPLYSSGADCDITNPCIRCPEGEHCLGGVCIKLKPTECKLEYGCDCTDSSDCSTGYCATDGKCRHTALVYNDFCVDNVQCSSGHCELGTCNGLAIGSPCSDTSSNPCVFGARCTLNEDGFACVPTLQLGEACQSTGDCDYYNAACVNSVCADALSLDEGAECKSTYYCKVGLMCIDNKCQGPPLGNCVTSSCPSTYSCECNGTSGTACLPIKNTCHREYGEFISCMRRNNCTRLYAPGMNYFTDDMCSYRCLNEAIATFCCGDCGGVSRNIITDPPYFLNCGTASFNYQPSCGTCEQPPLSVCTAPTTPPTDSQIDPLDTTETDSETHSSLPTETEPSDIEPNASSATEIGIFLPALIVCLL